MELAKCRWKVCTLLTFLTCVCFYNSLENGLVHDDIFAIQNNQDIRSETSLINIFYNDFWGRDITSDKSHKSYRPLSILTFRLNFMIHGLEPFGYHLVNVVMHVLVSYLYFHILYCIFGDSITALFAALLFTCHPVHVEAVSDLMLFSIIRKF